MRFETRHDVWTDGTRVVVVWGTGDLCAYVAGKAKAPELESWLGLDDDPWPVGQPPEPIVLRWGELAGWGPPAADTVDAAGGWTLHRDRSGLRLAGRAAPPLPEAHTVEVAPGDMAPQPELPRVGPRAHLCASDAGTVLVDASHGLIWCLEAAVAHRLSGVGPGWTLRAVRVPDAVVVHGTSEDGLSVLVRIDDRGGMSSGSPTAGATHRLQWTDTVVRGVIGGNSPQFIEVDPTSLRVTHVGAGGIRLDAGAWTGHCAGGLWVATNGEQVVILHQREGVWVERVKMGPPTGDPTKQAGHPRLAEVETAHWEGKPGDFEVRVHLRNIGKHRAGMHLDVSHPDTVRITALVLGGQRATLDDGRATFAHVGLRHQTPVPLTIRGRATGPGIVGLRACWDVDPRNPAKELGKFTIEVVVRSSLHAVRGTERIDLDSTWTAELMRRSVLDVERPEPDLTRWLARALSRLRVQAVADDPEGVLAAWRRMSERDRKASAGRKVPAYKLASGRHWVITDPEAKAIRSALGADHPFGRFAAGGAFEVCGTDPLVRDGD